MVDKDRVDLQFDPSDSKCEIFIPMLRSRGGSSVKLPFKDFANGGKLPKERQVLLGITRREANDLIRAWPQVFKIKKKPQKREEAIE